MIVNAEDAPVAARELDAMVCWMSEQPLRPRGRYAIKHTTRTAKVILEEIEYSIDVNTLAHEPASEVALNEIARVKLRCSAELVVDPYARNRTTGSFILIDEASNDTVAAGMIRGAR
jgi:sulfate adenylyltransferase subunit 1 (EFTu-like GTPase family)